MKNQLFNSLTVLCSCIALCFAFDARAEKEEAADLRPVIGVDAKFIENKTSNRSLNFAALVDRLTHELTELGIYQVATAKDMAELLKNNDVEWVLFDDIGESNKPLRRALYLRFVVSSYGWKNSIGYDRLTGTRIQQIEANLEALLFLVDSKTGKMLKSVNLQPVKVVKQIKTGSNQGNASNLGQVALQEAARILAKASVLETIKFTKFAILDVDAKTGKIMIEPTAGVTKVGDQYKVVRPGKKIRTKRGIIRKMKDIGVLRVTEVNEDYSSAILIQLYEKGAEIKVGDMIQILQVQRMHQAPQTAPSSDRAVGQPW